MIIESEPKRKFKAVLFDMGGVLLRYRNPMAYQALNENGKGKQKCQIFFVAKKYRDVATALNNFDKGIESVEELPDLMKPLMPGLIFNGEIEETKVEDYSELNFDLLEVARRIQNNGIKIAIVTNNGFWSKKRERSVLIDSQITSMFDAVIESCRIGVRKPEEEIFLVFIIS